MVSLEDSSFYDETKAIKKLAMELKFFEEEEGLTSIENNLGISVSLAYSSEIARSS